MTSHSLPHCRLSTCGITSCGRREEDVCWCLGVWCWPWLHNYYFESIYKEQNLVCRDFQAHTHRSTHTHEHTDYTKLHLHNLKQAANRDLRQMKTAARNGRHGGSVVLGKRSVFRLHLHEAREGFCWRGRGKAFHADGPKTEKVWEPTAESLVRGIWTLSISGFSQWSPVIFGFYWTGCHRSASLNSLGRWSQYSRTWACS